MINNILKLKFEKVTDLESPPITFLPFNPTFNPTFIGPFYTKTTKIESVNRNLSPFENLDFTNF